MKRPIWGALCLFYVLLSGCAATKSAFQATWYFVDESTGRDQPRMEMYVAILNQSPEVIKVNSIILNAVENKPQSGWRLDGVNRAFEPGEILLRRIKDFTRENGTGMKEAMGNCRVPVRVLVLTEPADAVRADIIGAMPSSVPEGWQEKCAK